MLKGLKDQEEGEATAGAGGDEAEVGEVGWAEAVAD